MADLKGIEYLRAKLNRVRARGMVRYSYYEQKHSHLARTVAIPAQVADRYRTKLGWCTSAVDQLAYRLVVDGFSNDNYNIADIFKVNNADILFSSAVLGALITSCDFVYIIPQGDGEIPKMQIIDGTNATGIIDPVTCILKEGYAVLERDPDTDSVISESYFIPGKIYVINGDDVTEIDVPGNAVALVPVVYKPDSKRWFGHSRISRACMQSQDEAEDAMMMIKALSDVAAWPQKYVLGLSESAQDIDSIRASISSMLDFRKDEDGDKPTVGQFPQMTLDSHLNAYKLMASKFSGETGLTLDDLGYVSENPSSAEAIKAAHETLRVTAANAQRDFAVGFLNAGYTAACIRDNVAYSRDLIADTAIRWKPIVEPDAAMLSAIGDGAIKLNQALPGYINKDNLKQLTGIEGGSANGEGLGLIDFEE